MTLTPRFEDVEPKSLPDCASKKLTLLRRAVADSRALFEAAQAEFREAVEVDNVDIERADALRSRKDARAIKRDHAIQLLLKCEELVRVNDGKLAAYAGSVPASGTLDEVRTKIKELRDESVALAKQRPTADDVKSRLRSGLGDLARCEIDEKGRPRFATRISASDPNFNAVDLRALRMLYLVVPSAVEKAIDKLIDEQYPADGLEDAWRRLKKRDAADELLLLERREEALVVQAQDQGLDVYRRPKANPLAVLGVAFK